MARRRTIDSSVGWQTREFAKLWKAIREQAAAKRLQAAEIAAGGIKMLAGSAITVLYPSGRKVLQIGSFTGANANLEEVPGVGLRLMLDADYGFIGIPNVQPALLDLFRDEDTGEVNAQFGGVTQFNVFSAKDAKLYGSNQNAMIGVEEAGDVTLSPATGKDVHAFVQTTANAANVYVDASTGALQRSTSSRRYKQDIEDATIDTDAVLALVPRQFRRKDEVEKLGDDAPVYTGFIAEDAASGGLHAWVRADDEGPESFDYAGFAAVAHQAVLRSLRDENADLRRRVEALESAEAKPTEG